MHHGLRPVHQALRQILVCWVSDRFILGYAVPSEVFGLSTQGRPSPESDLDPHDRTTHRKPGQDR